MSRRPRQDESSSSSRTPAARPPTSRSSSSSTTSTASAPPTMATTHLPPIGAFPFPGDYTTAPNMPPSEPYASYGRPPAPTGPGQTAYSSTGYAPRPEYGQPEPRAPSGRRPPGAVPISNLLSQEPEPPRRPSGISTSGDARQMHRGTPLSSPGSIAPSPTTARSQPSSGRREFFDPARDLRDEDVPMAEAGPLTSPYQPSFPATSPPGYDPMLGSGGPTTGYHTEPLPGAPVEYVPLYPPF